MSELKITGTIKTIGEKQEFDSGFYKRELIIETGGEYPQLVKFEVTKERSDKLTEYNKEGDLVTVKFDIRGNEYNSKIYNNLNAWRIEKAVAFEGVKQEEPTVEELANEDTGLPF